MHPTLTPTDYALLLGARGCHVFRIKAGTKDFFIDKRWAYEPIAGALEIFDAFTRNNGECAGYNYGVNAGASDLLILDIDRKGAVDGLANLATLGAVPNTFAVRTPSGGLHYYLKANGLKFGQADLAPGVQVRAHHGYVVGPGSRFEDKIYEIERDAPFADLPEWIAHKASPLTTRPSRPGAALTEPDTPEAIEAARNYIAALPLVREGGRNVACFAAACRCLDFGCSPETAAELLIEGFNAHPPLDAGEIEGVCDRVLATYIGPIGKELSGHGFEPVSAPKAIEHVVSFSPTPYAWTDPASIPPREWLYDRHLIRKYVSGTISPGGVGKSALKIAEAISMASGKGLLTGKDAAPLRVWYWNGEDPDEETNRRVSATCKHYGIGPDQLGGRLFLDSGRNVKIVIAKETRNGLVVASPVRDALIRAITENRIDVLLIDPFVRSHEVTENDNSKIEAVANEFRQIADVANCAVELVHHSRKTGGAEVTAEDARGGSALVNAFRQARVLNQMTEEQARKACLTNETQRKLHFRMDDAKANLAPPTNVARWFKLESVDLGNSRPGLAQDNVGVVTPWTWPNAFDGVPPGSLESAKAAVAGKQWRENAQAQDWVGVPIAAVLGFDLNHDGQKKRVSDIVRTWIADGHFRVVDGFDESRKPRKFVEV